LFHFPSFRKKKRRGGKGEEFWPAALHPHRGLARKKKKRGGEGNPLPFYSFSLARGLRGRKGRRKRESTICEGYSYICPSDTAASLPQEKGGGKRPEKGFFVILRAGDGGKGGKRPRCLSRGRLDQGGKRGRRGCTVTFYFVPEASGERGGKVILVPRPPLSLEKGERGGEGHGPSYLILTR